MPTDSENLNAHPGSLHPVVRRICELEAALADCLSTYREDAKTVIVTEERQETWREVLNRKCSTAETLEVIGWAQAVLTALNVGAVQSGSKLHLKLREVMIAYRAANDDA